MQPLVFDSSPLTFEEYKAINWQYIWKTRKFILAIPLVYTSAIIIKSLGGNNHSTLQDNLGNIALAVLTLVMLVGMVFFAARRTFKKNYLNTPALATGLTYTLSNESIAAAGPSFNIEQPWPVSYKKAVQIGKWVLLTSSAGAAYFLDMEKLLMPASANDVLALFQEKGVKLIK